MARKCQNKIVLKKPTYKEMIIDAIERNCNHSCSFLAIAKSIEAQYPDLLDHQESFRQHLKAAIKKAIDAGVLEKIKQSYKLTQNHKKVQKVFQDEKKERKIVASKKTKRKSTKKEVTPTKTKKAKRKLERQQDGQGEQLSSSHSFWNESEEDYESSPTHYHQSGTESDSEYRKKINLRVRRRLSF